MMSNLTFLILCIFSLVNCVNVQKLNNEECAKDWAESVNTKYKELLNVFVKASWKRATNITKENSRLELEASLNSSKYNMKITTLAKIFDWKFFTNASLKRLYSFIDGPVEKNATLTKEIISIEMEMSNIYSKAKVIKGTRRYSLDPDLTRIMSNSQSYDELLWAWRGWRDVSGKKMRKRYLNYITAVQKQAKDLGYTDAVQMKLGVYEDPDFEKNMKMALDKIRPLNQLLHAYVRKKLRTKFPSKYFPKSGHLPAHVFGDMWAQSWSNLQPFVTPYPNATNMNITQNMISQKYSPRKMFNMSDDFFKSMGLIGMPSLFWKKSLIEKPKDGRDLVCHASAWNFFDSEDFRIKQCTVVTLDNFLTVHHEMGHIQYYLQYKDLPIVFQSGANPGFHEAIGDAITLSVQTPKHLKKVNLITDYKDNNESDINYLMSIALEKIAFLPFGYLMDSWRWELYREKDIYKVDINKRWWNLRCKYQGIYPPIMRSESDFDPGSKYHIAADVPYIRYFFSHIFQFQLHKAMCKANNHIGLLHKCSIFNSTKAGKVLSDGLKLGRSKHWKDVMEKMTGERELDTSPLLEFFEPLIVWLKDEVRDEQPVWEDDCPGPEFYDTLSAPGQHVSSLVVVATLISSLTIGFGLI